MVLSRHGLSRGEASSPSRLLKSNPAGLIMLSRDDRESGGKHSKSFFYLQGVKMTTKEIAEIAGVSERTVRRIAENEVGYVYEKGKKAIYTEKEAIEIMSLARKQGFIQPRQNAVVPRQNADVESILSDRDIAIISKIVSVTVSETMKALDNRVAKIETRIEQRQALLPAPQVDSRTHITMIVNDFVSKTGRDHRDIYNQLYREYGYRTHCNASLSAKNRGMKIIDFIESEGQIEILESIAMEIFK